MLRSLHLKCVRQHLDRDFTFTEGLNILWGANEKGKSSLIEGLAYCLFGSQAVQGKLENFVTDGHELSELHTCTELDLAGSQYRIERGTAGAEVYRNGELEATGHTSVTEYVEKFFGIPSGTAPLLMIAQQNDMRGALEHKKKDASNFIERVAGVDDLDELIDYLLSVMTTGSDAAAKLSVQALENSLSGMPDVSVPPAANPWEGLVKAAKYDLDAVEVALHKALQQQATYEAQKLERSRLEERIQKGEQQLQALEIEMGGTLALDTVELERELSDALVALDGARADEKYRSCVQKFRPWLEWTGDVWEGDRSSLVDAVEAAASEGAAILRRLADAEARVKSEMSKIITDICPTCKQPVPDAEEVRRLNAEAEAAAVAAREEAERLKTLFLKQQEERSLLQAILDKDAEMLWDWNVCDLKDLFSFTPNVLPHHNLTARPVEALAKGTTVDAAAYQVRNIQSKLDEARKLREKRSRAFASHQVLLESVAAAKTQLLDLQATALQNVCVTRYQQAHQEAKAKHSQAVEMLYNYEAERQAALSAVERRRQAEAQLFIAKQDLATLQGNNALIKAVRNAKTKVTAKLWSEVALIVSQYFSLLRGKESSFTRSTEGFLVDGKPIEILSGSTKDILGLALRLGLTKIFFPLADFQILDEPSAAADAERTNLITETLLASGLQQIIMVTHKSSDEVYCSNLIAI